MPPKKGCICHRLFSYCLSIVDLLSTHHPLCIRFHIKDTRREKYGDENPKTLTSMTHMGGILEKRGGAGDFLVHLGIWGCALNDQNIV